MKHGFLLILMILFIQTLTAQQPERPKIGLTLSGGGAKGLAHIGILKAIDSAGLKIDYITGTSMGAVIGSLYAIGYSGDQIEKMARKIDWDLLLSNQLSLRLLSMEEKEEYGKYAIELPYVNRRLQIPGGILEGQEMWLKLAQMYYPVHGVKDFDRFPIPFRCVATDVATGQAVVIGYGDLSTAVRASMAIPSVFSSVDFEGYRLVDGGITRNFPVRDVREMGADIVIGSSVASGLASKDKVVSAVDVLLQMAFFKEAEDYKQEVELCDYFIFQPLEKYSMGSFNSANKLMDAGTQEGRKLYPQFKALADSLNRIYGNATQPVHRLPEEDSVFIRNYEINGLEHTTASFFIHAMDFRTNRNYSEAMISKLIRRVFGTRYYSSITYELQKNPDGTDRIVFYVKENAPTYIKLGLHYNDFSGIGVIGNLTTRDFFTPFSRSLVTVSVGENLRLKGEHLQYFGIRKNISLIPKFQLESFKINTYNGFNKSGQYRQLYYEGEMKLQYSGARGFTPGIGTRYEWLRFKPLIESNFEADGKNNFLTSFVYMNVNTLDKAFFPRRGFKIKSEFGFVYNQQPRVSYFIDGLPVSNVDSLGIDYGNYSRLTLSADAYAPLSQRLTLNGLFQLGVNFNYKQNFVNSFQVGGLVPTMRNQILFAGLEEGTFRTPSVSTAMIGFNYQLSKNIYLKARTNALIQNFVSPDRQIQLDNWVTGHAVGFAYNTPIGPLELNLTYCDQSRKTLTYVNFGIPF